MSFTAAGEGRDESPVQEAKAYRLQYLEDLWDDQVASGLDEPELLRYRSNLLGSDLRITNFSGGNTSSKVEMPDPLTGAETAVLWVKGSGGDLGSIRRGGFATLYLDKLLALEALYRGVEHEDSMVDYYPLCTFGLNPVAASIDTPLHGFLPFRHVDHLHPDCVIAMAAAANGRRKMEEFNLRWSHRLLWLPWQRPGFELGMMMKRAVEQNPGCDGIVLGGHGLFTWGETQRECYRNTVTLIDQITGFIAEHERGSGRRAFGGTVVPDSSERGRMAVRVLPFLRGRMGGERRMIASYSDHPDALEFVNSRDARRLAYLGTSCPDHFIRTKIRPLFVPWQPDEGEEALRRAIDLQLANYRREYSDYYRLHAQQDSPAMRDPNPTVVLVPGLGMFSFGRTKAESRIVGEFYLNAIHVMKGAGALEDGAVPGLLPQCGSENLAQAFQVYGNYVSLPPSEAFRIEYWSLEDAKIRRQPPEKELSRRIVLVAGAAGDVGRAVALAAASRGAHVVVADRDEEGAGRVADEAARIAGGEAVMTLPLDALRQESVTAMVRRTVERFGGIDILILVSDEAGPGSRSGRGTGEASAAAASVAEQAGAVMRQQGLECAAVLVMPAAPDPDPPAGPTVHPEGKPSMDRRASVAGAEDAGPRDRVRELAAILADGVRVNGVTVPDTVALPEATAELVLFLAGPRARCVDGQVLPIVCETPADGGAMQS